MVTWGAEAGRWDRVVLAGFVWALALAICVRRLLILIKSLVARWRDRYCLLSIGFSFVDLVQILYLEVNSPFALLIRFLRQL